MDFYFHLACRMFRHTAIVECESTRRTAALCIMALMQGDESVEPTTAWYDALDAVEDAAQAIAARRARKGARFAALRASTERIDRSGQYADWLWRRRVRRALRVEFA
jgi:hypothetical protein